MRRLGIVAVGLAFVVVAMVALVAAWLSGLGLAKAAPPPTPNITITGPAGPVLVGENFDVNISIDSGTTVFEYYQVEVDVPAGVTFVSGTHQALQAPFPSCLEWAVGPIAGPTSQWTSCGRSPPQTAAFAGLVETVTLRCESGGTYPLNLVDFAEDPTNGSVLFDDAGWVGTNVTPDNTVFVTCSLSVGGIAELPSLASAPGTGTSRMGGTTYAVLAGAVAGMLAFAVLATLTVKRRGVR
jgi:hypothetical protein